MCLYGWYGCGKGLLYLQQVGEGDMLILLLFLHWHFFFLHPPLFLSPSPLLVLSLLSLSLGDNTEWPTRSDKDHVDAQDGLNFAYEKKQKKLRL